MKKIARPALYILIFILLFIALQRLFYADPDPRNSLVWNKLQLDGSTSDVLIMGNSQAYTSLDADILSQGLDLDVNILATNAQSMEMTAANLRTLLRSHRPGMILLEASSVMTPAHDRLQGAAVSMVYANADGIHNVWQRLLNAVAALKPLQLPQAILPLLRPLSATERMQNASANLRGVRPELSSVRGSELRMTSASSPVDDLVRVKADAQLALRQKYKDTDAEGMIDEYNSKAFVEFCRLADEAGIPILLYKSPYLLWDAEMELRWQALLTLVSHQSGQISLLTDGCLYMPEAELEIQDFYDGEHLNLRGAEKFSRYLGEQLAERLKLLPDWSFMPQNLPELESNQCTLQ